MDDEFVNLNRVEREMGHVRSMLTGGGGGERWPLEIWERLDIPGSSFLKANRKGKRVNRDFSVWRDSTYTTTRTELRITTTRSAKRRAVL